MTLMPQTQYHSRRDYSPQAGIASNSNQFNNLSNTITTNIKIQDSIISRLKRQIYTSSSGTKKIPLQKNIKTYSINDHLYDQEIVKKEKNSERALESFSYIDKQKYPGTKQLYNGKSESYEKQPKKSLSILNKNLTTAMKENFSKQTIYKDSTVNKLQNFLSNKNQPQNRSMDTSRYEKLQTVIKNLTMNIKSFHNNEDLLKKKSNLNINECEKILELDKEIKQIQNVESDLNKIKGKENIQSTARNSIDRDNLGRSTQSRAGNSIDRDNLALSTQSRARNWIDRDNLARSTHNRARNSIDRDNLARRQCVKPKISFSKTIDSKVEHPFRIFDRFNNKSKNGICKTLPSVTSSDRMFQTDYGNFINENKLDFVNNRQQYNQDRAGNNKGKLLNRTNTRVSNSMLRHRSKSRLYQNNSIDNDLVDKTSQDLSDVSTMYKTFC